ncbi:hypothetical protein [Colwellia piezophila]|nr:hypothetical protein [Colwellia piezophila]
MNYNFNSKYNTDANNARMFNFDDFVIIAIYNKTLPISHGVFLSGN